MIYFNKLFRIPGPKDLGMAKSNNAMTMEYFRNSPDEYTWEQYYARVKAEYPIRFFFASTLPSLFRDAYNRVARPLGRALYWITSHTIHRYHLIDIRQLPKIGDAPNVDTYRYRYGWIDADTKMVLAMMTVLCEFVEKEGPHYCPSQEDADKDDGNNEFAGCRLQREYHNEFMSIYNYWKHTRPRLETEHNAILHEWSKARRRGKNSDETKALWNKLNAAESYKDKLLDDMLHRLIAIRHRLWT